MLIHDLIDVVDVLFPTDAFHSCFLIIVGFNHDPLATKMPMAHNGWLRVARMLL
jgi:hypothetical protein